MLILLSSDKSLQLSNSYDLLGLLSLCHSLDRVPCKNIRESLSSPYFFLSFSDYSFALFVVPSLRTIVLYISMYDRITAVVLHCGLSKISFKHFSQIVILCIYIFIPYDFCTIFYLFSIYLNHIHFSLVQVSR